MVVPTLRKLFMLPLARGLTNCGAPHNCVSKSSLCRFFVLTITPRLFYSTHFAGSLSTLQLILSICLIQTGVQKKRKHKQGRTRLVVFSGSSPPAFVFSVTATIRKHTAFFCVRACVVKFSAQGALSLMRSQDVSLERDGAECKRVPRVPR